MQKLDKVVYTAKAKSTGGREGTSQTDDGRLKVTLSTPKVMGGTDGPGTNPEQLFAAGYSACFIGAMKVAAMQSKTKLPDDVSVDAQVEFGPVGSAYGLAVALHVNMPNVEPALAQTIVNKAHEMCPYSNATRGNIEVRLTVGS
ncbi:MAG: organic hydroperoxide resistance protein [Proteobacteria bacterium]|nr:MAG: organic hydroperoxide resistance protein [Pseudomonadota bacterium]